MRSTAAEQATSASESAARRLKALLGDAVQEPRVERDGVLTVAVAREAVIAVLTELRDNPDHEFRVLIDLTAVDYGHGKRTPRFDVVYSLLSRRDVARIRLAVGVDEGDEWVPTATSVYPCANWLEREVYDLMGIRFDGHPDLKRIELPEDYDGHPLRKEFPLRGGHRQVRRPEDPEPHFGHRFRAR